MFARAFEGHAVSVMFETGESGDEKWKTEE